MQSSKVKSVSANNTSLTNIHDGEQMTSIRAIGDHKQKFVRLKNWITEKQVTDTLHEQKNRQSHCNKDYCKGSIMFPSKNTSDGELLPKDIAVKDAVDFLRQYYISIKKADSLAYNCRVQQVKKEIEEKGTYEMDAKELVFGAKLAWRNAPRCVGRIQWNKLQVFDCRDVFNAQQMFEAVCKHIKYGTNKGNLRSAITVFPQRRGAGNDFRIWNAQLIRYAGYKLEDGSIIGDPVSVEFTEICISFGWQPKYGRFDILPLILQANGEEPELFEIPRDIILEVKMSHPEYEWFEDLGLKWYALPAVSSLMLNCGGIEYPATPFNGWYMGTEIGARNFGDTYRYNMLPTIAEKMGLNTSNNGSLWKDKALVELNIAVLHSFQLANITIADHHTTTESFIKHVANEERARGGCPADWVWIVPPISGSATPVFHLEMLNYNLKPSYDYQEDPWKFYNFSATKEQKKKLMFKQVAKAVEFSAKLMGHAMAKRQKVTILYATETGKSEHYANLLKELFSFAFNPRVFCMVEYDFTDLEYEELLLIVTSTFGNGDAPENGESFAHELYELRHPPTNIKSEQKPKFRRQISQLLMDVNNDGTKTRNESQPLANLRYSIFGLGSNAYPNFCAFAKSLDKLILELGGESILSLGTGDELCGQEESFKNWAKDVFKAACETFCIEDTNMTSSSTSLDTISAKWSPDKFKFVHSKEKPAELCVSLSDLYRGTIHPCKLIEQINLQSGDASRATLLVKINTNGEKNMSFKPGDHVSIFPANNVKLVSTLLNKLHNAPQPDKALTMQTCREESGPFGKTTKWCMMSSLPNPFTLREAFSRYIDITSTPSPQILTYLSTLTSNEAEKKELEILGKGESEYEEWKYHKNKNIVEVIQDFSSLKVPAALLLTQLPRLQPRFYSISSSPQVYPDEIHATVAVVRFKKENGKGSIHNGVCSTWLESLKPGDIIPCSIRHAHSFHMPEDTSLPVIMVGPGTGIAPFRSFWQQRMFDRNNKIIDKGKHQRTSLGQTWGPMSLYFGCRMAQHDNIYKNETNHAMKEGGLDNVYTAFSREPNIPKTYVQDLIKQNVVEIYDMLVNKRGHFYVCGDVSMANDVHTSLEHALQQEGTKQNKNTKDFVGNMKNNGVYHEDIFGITLRTKETTDKARQNRGKISSS
ncbi:nitric oxide synthase, brain-like isoform X2 [Xenia sp. Carnegie-2017]|uniref:nitric oxide synthase, brain-like isoform X2 n=1 Tax=Xenia sp. Carnegie-2017 TaxID=2897299 RepID=UPI001F04121D|nr:nitric oxide synthase, brain-like isoform X2 [Xenia sp. Carnegie-2017]XP_046839566.1 nitric oxide synthase, brain-like isoform X2 [Xenia sp. Carnegie-2017]